MRLLFDECVPRPLKRLLPSHECVTVAEAGWKGLSDGEVLRRSRGRFDAFLTVDHSIPFQQHREGSSTPLVVLRANSNSVTALAPLMPSLEAALERLSPGAVIVVDSPG